MGATQFQGEQLIHHFFTVGEHTQSPFTMLQTVVQAQPLQLLSLASYKLCTTFARYAEWVVRIGL